MSWTSDLVAGVAELLAAANVGAWSTTGTYTDGQVPIVAGMLPQTPDRAIGLTPYPVETTPGLIDVTVGLQVRCRGTTDLRDVQDLDDAVYDALHGATPGNVRGVLVAQIFWQSGTPLGADQLARLEHSSNYYIQASRPHFNAL